MTQATVSVTTNHRAASVFIVPTDVDDNTPGYQVDLTAGRNLVGIVVTAQDGTTTKRYRLYINRGVTDTFGWNAEYDFDSLYAAGNRVPTGIWSDGTTMWVAEDDDEKLYAYRLSDGSRDSAKDFDTLKESGNTNPSEIWSDGTTMWVLDNVGKKIYAYRLSDKSHDPSKDFNTLYRAGNDSPAAIWSDRTTMWVANTFDDKIYAYRMSDGSRDSGKDFDTLEATDNGYGTAIWSDGTTMWVMDQVDATIYAYHMSDKTRYESRDFNTLGAIGIRRVWGMWSNGTTMWVSEADDDKIYAFNMPEPDTTAPRLLTAAVNGSALLLSYDEPLNGNSQPNTDAYTVRVGRSNVAVSTVSISDSVVTLTLEPPAEDIHNSIRVTYQVPSSNPVQDHAGNNAARINNKSVTNNTPGPTEPGAPTDLTATPQGQNQIHLSWSVPASTGGSAITGYRIEVSEDGGSAWTDLVANTRTTSTTYAHTGLTLGSKRHYRVSATSRGGTSVPSSVANATTNSRPFATLSARLTGYDTVPVQTGTQRIPKYEIIIEFSQPVEGVDDKFLPDAARTYLTNATLMSWGAVPTGQDPGSGPWLTKWRMDIVPDQPKNGGTTIVTMTLPEGVVQDTGGQLNQAATPLQLEVTNLPPGDSNRPNVYVKTKGSEIIKTKSFTVQATFDEPVSGFEQNDFSITGGRITSFAAVPGDKVYEVTVRPNDPSNIETTGTFAVRANAAQDGAGNRNLATATYGFVARPRPVATLTLPKDKDGFYVNQHSAFEATINFSERVTGFTKAGLIVSGTPLTGGCQTQVPGDATISKWDAKGGGKEYVATITPTKIGRLNIRVAAAVALDGDLHSNLGTRNRCVTLIEAPDDD